MFRLPHEAPLPDTGATQGITTDSTDSTSFRNGSKCSQQFGRQDAFGRVQMLDPRAAIDLYFSTGTYAVAEIESDQGRQERSQRADEQRRVAEVQSLRAQVELLRGSGSDLVRSHAQALLKKLNSNPPPSSIVLETARQDQQALTQLARAETERLEQLEKLDAVKRRAESRATGTFAPELRGELDRLRASYTSLSKQLAPATPGAPDRVGTIGPSFTCAGASTLIQRVICAEPSLRRLDLEALQPVYVLRHAQPGTRDQMRDDGNALTQRVERKCRLSPDGRITHKGLREAIRCVEAEYRRQSQAWRQQVAREAPGAGAEEAARPVEEHVKLHELLKKAGVLQGTQVADGIYGGVTRASIAEFQRSEAMPPHGLMSNATAERLLRRVGTGEANLTASIPAITARRTQLADLQQRYEGRYRARGRNRSATDTSYSGVEQNC
jgi:peptidoglycan hydrolase-like protein with peptidoglycan-binding domain